MPEEIKRTSLDLPLALWKSVKVQAIEEGTDFRSLVIRALEAYLRSAKAPGGVHRKGGRS
jgi:hypothetical protein